MHSRAAALFSGILSWPAKDGLVQGRMLFLVPRVRRVLRKTRTKGRERGGARALVANPKGDGQELRVEIPVLRVVIPRLKIESVRSFTYSYRESHAGVRAPRTGRRIDDGLVGDHCPRSATESPPEPDWRADGACAGDHGAGEIRVAVIPASAADRICSKGLSAQLVPVVPGQDKEVGGAIKTGCF